MIHQTIDIDQYHWIVQVFLDSHGNDSEIIMSELYRLGIRGEQRARAEEHLQTAAYNSGMTYTCPEMRESVLVVGQSTSVRETMDTFSHELRHLVDDIALVRGIYSSGEEGDIAFAVASALLQIVC